MAAYSTAEIVHAGNWNMPALIVMGAVILGYIFLNARVPSDKEGSDEAGDVKKEDFVDPNMQRWIEDRGKQDHHR